MKKIILWLIIIFLLILFQSCQKLSNVGLKENEIKILLENLIPRGIKIHDLMRFSIEYSPINKINMYNNDYCEVINGYSNTNEIKNELKSVFTEKIVEKEFNNYFNSSNGVGPKFIDFEGKLYINMEFGDYGGQIVWLVKEMMIIQQNKEIIVLKIPVYYIAYEGSEKNIEIRELTLKKENETWKLDSIVY